VAAAVGEVVECRAGVAGECREAAVAIAAADRGPLRGARRPCRAHPLAARRAGAIPAARADRAAALRWVTCLRPARARRDLAAVYPAGRVAAGRLAACGQAPERGPAGGNLPAHDLAAIMAAVDRPRAT
jgi:hypothetical protein